MGLLQKKQEWNMATTASSATTTFAISSTITAVVKDTLHHVEEPMIIGKQQKRKINDGWLCPVSKKSSRTLNPVSNVVEPLAKRIKLGCQRKDKKDPISLAYGDPTVGSALPPCQAAIESVITRLLHNPHAAAYANACGIPEARKSIANHHSYPEHQISASSVIVSNGCSGALELAVTSLLDPGTILLVPQPGFPHYQVIAKSHGASVVHYRLDPEMNWECDIDHLNEIMKKHGKSVRAMVLNNPSNPTGAVFSEQHIVQILDFARLHRLPILADEVYGDITFGHHRFHPIAQVAARVGRQVPVITASGLSKQFLLPGWRVGWLTFHDNVHNSLNEVEAGAKRLAQVSLGASHLAQSVIPTLLSKSTPGLSAWKYDMKTSLERLASCLSSRLSKDCRGLKVHPAQGAFYAIVKIDCEALGVKDDKEFAFKLLEEENVFVVPGSAFGTPNVFRIAFCSPEPILELAARRMAEFCRRHAK